MKATIEIETKNPELILKSLEPDISNTKRFEVKFEVEKEKLILKVDAKDISALLAGINSYIKLIKISMEMIK